MTTITINFKKVVLNKKMPTSGIFPLIENLYADVSKDEYKYNLLTTAVPNLFTLIDPRAFITEISVYPEPKFYDVSISLI